ncbi:MULTISPECIES: class I SAM-dependent methyltransferase [unclassified Acinetobacter]|uniref:class I SAM-dependent methyltransferase n=1 Tax=unclassified Acinetobacter TaxID=196816 RepID=UPI0029349DA3|nr:MULTISPECIES: class I SAM-dependent methyltransferase [unclassified Acinetobacter]WOE30575.1 class I SAM-dependent methyltransferase [Acinetobacter sp. SAAs470]WOE38767.1 class I SAM-dependent methyltransferase [Acinetobacter sp. SAAs474]
MTQSLHPSAQKGFSLAAERYQQARPHYPENITYWLKNHLQLTPNHIILDLGSGTGKFLPYLQQITSHIIAIEPISAMLEQLKISYPHIQTQQAYSHQLPFSNEFADAITCAQSFHWFAQPETLTELYRVLKPNAQLILIWNQRDIDIAWVKQLDDVLQTLESDTPRYHSHQWKKVFEQQTQFKPIAETTFSLSHHGTVEQVVLQRLLSTSFIAALPHAEQNKLKQQFADIVYTHTGKTAQDEIDFPYTTHVYAFQKI